MYHTDVWNFTSSIVHENKILICIWLVEEMWDTLNYEKLKRKITVKNKTSYEIYKCIIKQYYMM